MGGDGWAEGAGGGHGGGGERGGDQGGKGGEGPAIVDRSREKDHDEEERDDALRTMAERTGKSRSNEGVPRATARQVSSGMIDLSRKAAAIPPSIGAAQ